MGVSKTCNVCIYPTRNRKHTHCGWYARLDVQLRPSPVTALSVVLSKYAYQSGNVAKIEPSQT